jgi:hypothetical protein
VSVLALRSRSGSVRRCVLVGSLVVVVPLVLLGWYWRASSSLLVRLSARSRVQKNKTESGQLGALVRPNANKTGALRDYDLSTATGNWKLVGSPARSLRSLGGSRSSEAFATYRCRFVSVLRSERERERVWRAAAAAAKLH